MSESDVQMLSMLGSLAGVAIAFWLFDLAHYYHVKREEDAMIARILEDIKREDATKSQPL